MVMTRTHAKIKVKGQFVQKIEWKQTDGETDTTDRITFPANVVRSVTNYFNLTDSWMVVRCMFDLLSL